MGLAVEILHGEAQVAAILLLLTAPAFAQATEPSPRELLSILNERSTANNQRFDAQEKAVAAALAAAKEAVAKAEAAAEKRFEGLNEFRGTLKDQQATLIPRAEVLALLKSMDEKIQNNEARLNQIISRAEGANWLWGLVSGAVGLLIGGALAVAGFRRRAS
jgi:hypothetical protein